MALNTEQKAAISIFVRTVGTIACAWVFFGELLFGQWWKDFLSGGMFEGIYWRDGVKELHQQIYNVTPLGFVLVIAPVCLIVYLIIGFRNPPKRAKGTLDTLKRIVPSWKLTIGSASIAVLTSILVLNQPGSYAQGKLLDFQNQILLQSFKSMATLTDSRFIPPQTGIYQYLNERLIIKQYRALQSDLEIKEKTDSTGKEESLSASASILNNAAKVEGGKKTSNDQSVTYAAPEISADFAAGKIIKRFVADTNTIRWGFLDVMVPNSDYVKMVNKNYGIQLTQEQEIQLKANDKARYQANLAKVQGGKIILYYGTVSFFKSNNELWIRVTEKGPVSVTATGQIEKNFLADSLMFSLEGKTEGREIAGLNVLSVVDDKHTDADGNVEITIIPECIWY